MGIRGYQTFNMLVTIESQYTWASTDYSLFGLRSDTTIPTGLSTSNSVDDTQSGSITDKTFTKSFIIPRVFDVLAIIDGTIQGTLKIVAAEDSSTASDYIEITKAELTIRAIDSSGTSRDVMAKQEIWSGSLKVLGDETSDSLQLMYWIEVEDAIIESDERLIVDYTLTYTVYDALAADTFTASIYCTPDADETTITLPFVM